MVSCKNFVYFIFGYFFFFVALPYKFFFDLLSRILRNGVAHGLSIDFIFTRLEGCHR